MPTKTCGTRGSASLPGRPLKRPVALLMRICGCSGTCSNLATLMRLPPSTGSMAATPAPRSWHGRAAAAPMSAASAQTAEVTDVALKNAAGTYVVPVRINGVFSLDFIVDSGASDVLLPADVVLTLVRTKTITADDFIGDSEYALADGSTLKSARFVLRQLQVGALTIDHVTASIGSVNSQPLLGDSFLSRFASWSIDNSRHVLRLTSATP